MMQQITYQRVSKVFKLN
uniref:Uncharacterized protein n=1 Tax=Rhizophora mucronata TaxID=61149 RepID=A0A2P2R482_RHIMU